MDNPITIQSDSDKLFSEILAVMAGCKNDTAILDLGLNISKLERARLTGLIITKPSKKEMDYRILAFQREIEDKLKTSGIPGTQLTIFSNDPFAPVIRRSQLYDLVIFPVDNNKIGSHGFTKFVNRCSSSFITMSSEIIPTMRRCLLVLVNNIHRNFSLENISYLSKSWQIDNIFILSENQDDIQIQSLQKTIDTSKINRMNIDFNKKGENLALRIISIAEENNCDLIIFYGHKPMIRKRSHYGSLINEIILNSPKPILFFK